ncbi:MAG: ATP-binding cassette domain-containing protein [Actinobacteria bacterium]|nr:ATP-binding cassette domain-containing protein [Actinomycetota bacterium]
MIEFERVGVRYHDAPTPVLREVSFVVDEGEFALVAGRTGAGKSTLLGAVNGHVPQFTGGTLVGHVRIAGRDTRDHAPRELAHLVGRVGQNPLEGFVTDTVERELAYGMEQLGTAPRRMRTRVEETLDLLGIADLRDRPLLTLSGGQQQRVAIGAVLAAGARVLVLDEPTSALDPTSAEEVLAALLRLVHDLGTTVLIAEHRLERVAEYADRLVLLTGDGGVRNGAPATLLAGMEIAPPVVQLGAALGWRPLPVSVRQARRLAPGLRARLAGADPDQHPVPEEPAASLPGTSDGLLARRIEVDYGTVLAVRGVDVELPAGRVTVLLGRNGSGKSSLLWALSGAGRIDGGEFRVGDTDLTRAGVTEVRDHVRMVPQNAADLLYLDTVAAECATADRAAAQRPGTCRAILDALAAGIPGGRNPRDLSEGQKLALVLAIQLTGNPRVVLLDEPTRGLDYLAKESLRRTVRGLAAAGSAVCLATHDVEFAAQVADRAVVMASGEVIAVGSSREVLASSAIFSPQVARVLAPAEWLTVGQVVRALKAIGG